MNKTTAHTPGPWRADAIDCQNWVIDQEGNYLVESVNMDSEGYYCTESATRAANIRLMAAAPDLLNALSDLLAELDNFGGCPNSSPAWDYARAAIAKATQA